MVEKSKVYCCRAHVEFQLNQEPHLPFWFTPAQLAGRLIINYKATHIEFFEFALPTDRQLNIGKLLLNCCNVPCILCADMEWITAADGSNNEVDIGELLIDLMLTAVTPEAMQLHAIKTKICKNIIC